MIGTDCAKTTLDNLRKSFDIINVPTFIVMRNGKEVGRVVEYGKYGQIDKELGEIVKRRCIFSSYRLDKPTKTYLHLYKAC